MNRIYQGKITNVEIANPDKHAPRILSASTGERTEVRCRNQNPWLPFHPEPKQAKAIGYRPTILGHSPQADAHQLFQHTVNSEFRQQL